MSNAMKYMMLIALVAVGFLFSVDAEAQCSMCKASAEAAAKENEMSMSERINGGILYLMVIPYIVFVIFFRKKIRNLFRELKNAARH